MKDPQGGFLVVFRDNKSLVFATAVLALLVGTGGFFLSHRHARADHSRLSVTVSGTDVADGSASALTAADITNVSANDGTRMQSDGNWPKSTPTYDEARYIEFVFSPNIPVDSVISAVSVTNVYRRTNTLTGAKIEVWDGTGWTHAHTLSIPGNTTTDATDTFDISSYINTAAKVNGIKVRFLAYVSGNTNTRTQHDFIQIHTTFTSAPTIVSVTISPTNPTTNSLLTATTTAIDSDGDPVTIQYQWKKNGNNVGTGGATLDLSQAGYGDKNDSITVLATATDDYGGTATRLSDPVVVQNSPPVVTPKTATTAENSPVDIALDGTDADNDTLTYGLPEPPLHGNVVINGSIATYTPNQYYDGSDVFTFEAIDGTAHSAHVSANITVTPVNYPPVASDQTAATEEHTPVTITLPAHDPDNDALSYAIDTPPTNGTLSAIFDTNKVTYTPTGHFFGTDTFTFHANDSLLSSGSANVSVSVVEVNDAPVASDGARTTDEDTPITISLSGSDPKGTPVTFATTTNPSHGALSIISGNTLTYTPDLNYSGSDQFLFRANDGIVDSNIATESLTITPVNDPPTIADLHDVTVNEGEALTITPIGSDPESPPEVLSYSLTDAPPGMSVNTSTGVISWTPTESQGPGYYSVTLDVSDGTLHGSISFGATVDEVNSAPVVQGADVITPYETAKDLTFAVTDADVPANTLTPFIVALPFHGSLVLTSGLGATYTPFPGFSGADSFLYAVSDGHASSTIATVHITVSPQIIVGRTGGAAVSESPSQEPGPAPIEEAQEIATSSEPRATSTPPAAKNAEEVRQPAGGKTPSKALAVTTASASKTGKRPPAPVQTVATSSATVSSTTPVTVATSTTPSPFSALRKQFQSVTTFIQGLFGKIRSFFSR